MRSSRNASSKRSRCSKALGLEDAVKAYLRAEYHFYLGSRRHTDVAQGWLSDALDNLREAATGETCPDKVARALGIDPKKERRDYEKRMKRRRKAFQESEPPTPRESSESLEEEPKRPKRRVFKKARRSNSGWQDFSLP